MLFRVHVIARRCLQLWKYYYYLLHQFILYLQQHIAIKTDLDNKTMYYTDCVKVTLIPECSIIDLLVNTLLSIQYHCVDSPKIS